MYIGRRCFKLILNKMKECVAGRHRRESGRNPKQGDPSADVDNAVSYMSTLCMSVAHGPCSFTVNYGLAAGRASVALCTVSWWLHCGCD